MESLHKLKKFFARIKKNNRTTILIFFLLAVVYTFFAFQKDYELDESLYILTGKLIVLGDLPTFSPDLFVYVFTSPLVPTIYGLLYLVGGFFLSRFISLSSVMVTMFLVYLLAKDLDPKSANV